MQNPVSRELEESDLERLTREYAAATRRLDALLKEAGDLGARFERIAHGLSSHPARMMIGLPNPLTEDPNDWDVLPGDPLPTVERLTTLTNDIRQTSQEIEALRERLILMGRADLVEEPNGFFH